MIKVFYKKYSNKLIIIFSFINIVLSIIRLITKLIIKSIKFTKKNNAALKYISKYNKKN